VEGLFKYFINKLKIHIYKKKKTNS